MLIKEKLKFILNNLICKIKSNKVKYLTIMLLIIISVLTFNNISTKLKTKGIYENTYIVDRFFFI